MVAWGCTWQLLRPGRLGSNHFAPLLQDFCEIFLMLKTSISPSPIFPNEPDHHIAHCSAGTRNIAMSQRGFLRTMGIVNIHVYLTAKETHLSNSHLIPETHIKFYRE